MASEQVIIRGSSVWNSSDSQRIPKQVIGLHLAAYFGLREVMIALLKNRHDLGSKDSNGRTPLSWAAEKGAELESKPDSDQALLSLAAEKKHAAVVKQYKYVAKVLLKSGLEVDFKSSWGQMPLSWAVEKGHEAVVKLLLEKGAELDCNDEYGRTPSPLTAEEGHEAVVTLLLKNGAELDSRSSWGQTPLSWAAEKGHEVMVTLLLEKGAELERKDKYGRTPLS